MSSSRLSHATRALVFLLCSLNGVSGFPVAQSGSCENDATGAHGLVTPIAGHAFKQSCAQTTHADLRASISLTTITTFSRSQPLTSSATLTAAGDKNPILAVPERGDVGLAVPQKRAADLTLPLPSDFPAIQHTGALGSTSRLPSGATVLSGTISGQPIYQTFLPITYPIFQSLTGSTTITTTMDGSATPVIIGPSGIGYSVATLESGPPRLLPPPIAPSPTPGQAPGPMGPPGPPIPAAAPGPLPGSPSQPSSEVPESSPGPFPIPASGPPSASVPTPPPMAAPESPSISVGPLPISTPEPSQPPAPAPGPLPAPSASPPAPDPATPGPPAPDPPSPNLPATEAPAPENPAPATPAPAASAAPEAPAPGAPAPEAPAPDAPAPEAPAPEDPAPPGPPAPLPPVAGPPASLPPVAGPPAAGPPAAGPPVSGPPINGPPTREPPAGGPPAGGPPAGGPPAGGPPNLPPLPNLLPPLPGLPPLPNLPLPHLPPSGPVSEPNPAPLDLIPVLQPPILAHRSLAIPSLPKTQSQAEHRVLKPQLAQPLRPAHQPLLHALRQHRGF